MTKKKKIDPYAKGITGREVGRRAAAHGIFEEIYHHVQGGQPGVWFVVIRDGFGATLIRSSIPTGYSRDMDGAYNATRENPTRLTKLSISRTKDKSFYYSGEKIGSWDTYCRHSPEYHNFEKNAKKDEVFARFLDDILTIFNSAKCPLSKKVN